MEQTASITTKPKAFSYLRFSTLEQAKGGSLGRQAKLAEDYCREHGLVLDTSMTFKDLGVSAFSGKNKKRGSALRAFLDAVEEEIIPEGSFLLVESLDRISRESIIEAQTTFMSIINAGVTLVTLKGTPKVYSRDYVNDHPTELIIAILEFMRSNEESATKSQRIKADWSKKIEKARDTGKAITARIPAWLTRVGDRFKVIEERAQIVRRMFSMTLEGHGGHYIAATFSKEGIEPFGITVDHVKGEFWHRSYVKRTLENEAVIGTFTPKRLVGSKRLPLDPIPDYFPAIIDRETWEAVAALREGVEKKAPPKAIASFFSGLTVCEQCGGPMIRVKKGHKRGERHTSFVCQKAKVGVGCKFQSVKQETLEEAFIKGIQRFISDAPSGDLDLDDQLAGIETEKRDHLGEIQNLLKAIARKPLPSLVDRLARHERELIELNAEEERLKAILRDTSRPLLEKRLADLQELVESEQPEKGKVNVVLRQMVEQIVITFDEDSSYRRPSGSLQFHWKGDLGVTAVQWGSLFRAVGKKLKGKLKAA